MVAPGDAELLTPAGQREVYAKRARNYDQTSELFALLGFPLGRYRDRAVDALGLEPGDTVVEIGCGTGGNFSRLEGAIGPTGRLVGVDLTPEMLDQARARVAREGWANVELVEADAGSYDFPAGIDGVLSTFALMLVPSYDKVVARAADALAPGGRIVVLDFQEPEWPEGLIKLYLPLLRAFGATREMGERHPWEAIEAALGNCRVREFYFGGVFLAVGEKR